MTENDVTIKFKWNHCGKNYRFQMKVNEHDAFWEAIFAFVPDFNDSLSYTDVNGDQISLSSKEGLLKLIDLYMNLKPKYVTIRTIPKFNEAQDNSEGEETNVSTTTYQETVGRNEYNVQARESESTIDQLPASSNDWKPDKNKEEYGKISDYFSRLNLSNSTPWKRIDPEVKYAPNPPVVPQCLPKSSAEVNSVSEAIVPTQIVDVADVAVKCELIAPEERTQVPVNVLSVDEGNNLATFEAQRDRFKKSHAHVANLNSAVNISHDVKDIPLPIHDAPKDLSIKNLACVEENPIPAINVSLDVGDIPLPIHDAPKDLSVKVNSQNNVATETMIPTNAGNIEGKCDFAILERLKDPCKKESAEFIFRCACAFGVFKVSFYDNTGKMVFEHAIDERIARTLTWHKKRIIYAAANAVAQNMPQTLSIKFLEDLDFRSFLAFVSQATSFGRAG
ncbi:hypothetical protein Ddc_04890 [Ditylenchus destructor]|nr:hypothetical protein Ddc_04890 [Ditylenchus destructor]